MHSTYLITYYWDYMHARVISVKAIIWKYSGVLIALSNHQKTQKTFSFHAYLGNKQIIIYKQLLFPYMLMGL